jgi:hypothetical protein
MCSSVNNEAPSLFHDLGTYKKSLPIIPASSGYILGISEWGENAADSFQNNKSSGESRATRFLPRQFIPSHVSCCQSFLKMDEEA